MFDDKNRRGESYVSTVSVVAETFARTPVRGLRLLDRSLQDVRRSHRPRLVSGRQARGVHWQIATSPLISRRHCVLHAWQGKASMVRNPDASQPVLANGWS